MDPLGEVFSSMHIKKATSTRLEATAPWGMKSTGGSEIKFVLVLRGGGILTTNAFPEPVHLSAGDVFIMLDEAPYFIVDQTGSEVMDCAEVDKLRVGNVIKIGGGGALTTFVGGEFLIDYLDAKPILMVLPKFLHLKRDQERTHSFQSILELLALEMEKPGLASESMVSRLYELLFIQAIRIYTLDCPKGSGGWLAGITDKQLGGTIRAMHSHLEQSWTVESLAERACMSRSAFASKFKAIVGQTPLEYLTQWRIYKAGVLIRRNDSSIAEVSHSVGYQSESAFTKVFKREMGVTPGEFRKHHATNGSLIFGL